MAIAVSILKMFSMRDCDPKASLCFGEDRVRVIGTIVSRGSILEIKRAVEWRIK
jgi:hypothetical protein